jgi:hypothetical protein
LLVVLAGTAVLYLWNLSASGYANDFYAAAVQAGTQSWKAWLFGSLDSGNAITVDKPPAALWLMTLSARIFGFSSWSLLVPQALMGVASVGLLHATVRRLAGPGAGLMAGAGLAVLGVVGLLAGTRRLSRVQLVGTVAAVLTGLVGTSAYAVATASVAHTGSIPSVGATATGMGGMGGPGGMGHGGGRPDGGTPPALPGATIARDAATTDGAAGGPGGGMGGEASTELTALLSATDSTWSAAVGTSQTAAGLALASGTAVMSLGGWSGSDSAVTLEQFQQYVDNGRIHYYVGGGQGGGPGGSADGTSSRIAAWVEANFTATTVGSQTVYDLTT